MSESHYAELGLLRGLSELLVLERQREPALWLSFMTTVPVPRLHEGQGESTEF